MGATKPACAGATARRQTARTLSSVTCRSSTTAPSATDRGSVARSSSWLAIAARPWRRWSSAAPKGPSDGRSTTLDHEVHERPPPATMTRSGVRPASSRLDLRARRGPAARARRRRSRRAPDPVAQLAVDLDRDLAGRLGDGGRVDVRPAWRCGSTTTPRRAAASRRDHSSSVMCGAAGASISRSRRIASSHASPTGDRRARGSGRGCSSAP